MKYRLALKQKNAVIFLDRKLGEKYNLMNEVDHTPINRARERVVSGLLFALR